MTFIPFSANVQNEEKETQKKDLKQSEPPSKPTTTSTNQENWGYDLYPERKSTSTTTSLGEALTGRGQEYLDKIKCERNVYKCIKTSPLVKLMIGALNSVGCNIDIRRHISCEECAPTVSGGFDPILNQVVVCQNVATDPGYVQGVLTHEMIHMFDYCQNKLDFKNIDHLACTEIRAANLAHCSFLSAFTSGSISLFNIKASHQQCVKDKALSSILAARNISKEEAVGAVERVFSKCYADLEPLGRRLRRNSEDIHKAFAEGPYYGYECDFE